MLLGTLGFGGCVQPDDDLDDDDATADDDASGDDDTMPDDDDSAADDDDSAGDDDDTAGDDDTSAPPDCATADGSGQVILDGDWPACNFVGSAMITDDESMVYISSEPLCCDLMTAYESMHQAAEAARDAAVAQAQSDLDGPAACQAQTDYYTTLLPWHDLIFPPGSCLASAYRDPLSPGTHTQGEWIGLLSRTVVSEADGALELIDGCAGVSSWADYGQLYEELFWTMTSWSEMGFFVAGELVITDLGAEWGASVADVPLGSGEPVTVSFDVVAPVCP